MLSLCSIEEKAVAIEQMCARRWTLSTFMLGRSFTYVHQVFNVKSTTKRELARAHNPSQTHHHIHRAPKIRFQGARRASLHQAEPDLIITQGFSHTRTRWASLQQRRVKHVVAKERVGEACPLKKGQVDPSLCFCLLIEVSETNEMTK